VQIRDIAVEDIRLGKNWKVVSEQVGLVPNPGAPNGEEFVANRLQEDDSFISEDDYRAYHCQGFLRFVHKL
jgi:hypothetical protein